MKQKTLYENSRNYSTQTRVYEKLSNAEDCPRKIDKFLKSKIKGKIVLDVGCGNGKYAKRFARLCKKYYCLDNSKQQLKKARKNTKGINNIKFILSSAEKIPLPDKSVDIVIATWTISVIVSFRKQKRILGEIQRVLAKNGKAYFVENDWKGEFEEMLGHTKRTRKRREWLMKQGYKIAKRIDTYFKFGSVEKARDTFYSIWGSRVSNLVKSRKIKQKLLVFEGL